MDHVLNQQMVASNSVPQVINFGYGAGINAVFDTVSTTTPIQTINEMTLFFKVVASTNGATVNCRGSSTCRIFCDGDSGCKELKIYVTPDSLPKLVISPSDCVDSTKWNQLIDGIRCPQLISGF